jgi:nicotinamidase-related amidase
VQTELFRIWENEVVVDKTTRDSFHKTSLASHIETAGFDPHTLQLVIIGLQSDYCIQTTARSAIARYPSARVSLVHGAHGTYDDEKGGRSAEEVSEQIERELRDEGVIIEDIN